MINRRNFLIGSVAVGASLLGTQALAQRVMDFEEVVESPLSPTIVSRKDGWTQTITGSGVELQVGDKFTIGGKDEVFIVTGVSTSTFTIK
jgi:hypothetical protein